MGQRKKLAPTTHPSTINSKPTNLNGDDQGDHAIARTGKVTAGGKEYRPRTVRPVIRATGKRYGRINKDTWGKGCRRHDFKGGNHRWDGGTRGDSGFFGSGNLTLPAFAVRPS